MSLVTDRLRTLFETLFQAHPWHGVNPRIEQSTSLRAYVEIVPTDTVKYELDKATGHLRIDRPQRFSSTCPTLYGFVPQTYCGETVAARCVERGGAESGVVGDGDPLDICILTEKTFSQGDFLAHVRPIGGLRMVDKNEVDDKIIAVLDEDVAYGHLQELSQAPQGLIDRLKHYFLSYKQRPDELAREGGSSLEPKRVRIAEVYGAEEALVVIARSEQDYAAKFGEPDERWAEFESLLKRADS